MNKQVEQIKAEIGRLILLHTKTDVCKDTFLVNVTKVADVLGKLFNFINTLEEEDINNGTDLGCGVIAPKLDYDKLDNILDESLPKETKESWNEFLTPEKEPAWIKELEAMPVENVQAAMDKIRVEHPIFEVGDIIIHKEEKDSLEVVEALRTEYEKGRFDAREEMMKSIIGMQQCSCNEITHRLIGGSWNLICPTDKMGLKNGDKVKLIIVKEEV